ncbi:MAG: hypothetical protein J2P58_04690, partial [Acidimicrobiaceae bacterium]|nr:hypothetical protein [Acidimicrobiaceae bacterium]
MNTKHGTTLWPDLATGYHYTNNNKTIAFNLRKGVKFTDGTPFNAAAVVYNWKRDLSTTCACQTSFLQTLGGRGNSRGQRLAGDATRQRSRPAELVGGFDDLHGKGGILHIRPGQLIVLHAIDDVADKRGVIGGVGGTDADLLGLEAFSRDLEFARRGHDEVPIPAPDRIMQVHVGVGRRVDIAGLDHSEGARSTEGDGHVILDRLVPYLVSEHRSGHTNLATGKPTKPVDEVDAEIDERSAARLVSVEHPRRALLDIALDRSTDHFERQVFEGLVGVTRLDLSFEVASRQDEGYGCERALPGRKVGKGSYLCIGDSAGLLHSKGNALVDEVASLLGHVTVTPQGEDEVGPGRFTQVGEVGAGRAGEPIRDLLG